MNIKSRDFEDLQPGQTGICPYLGLADDADSVRDFPSAGNVCHHVAPPVAPTLTHQTTCCLTTQYAQCRVYTAEHSGKMPVEFTCKPVRQPRKSFRWVFTGLVAAAALIVGLFLLNSARQAGQALPTAAVPTPVSTAVPFLLIRDATKTPTRAAALAAPTNTIQPTATPTAVPTRTPHSLDMVIGEQDKFIIHRVASGESLQLFATLNNTNPNVIKSVNHQLVVPIWVDSIIVIPLDRSDPGELPAFEPYEVTDKGLTLRDIAVNLNVDLETLSQYNKLLPEDMLEPGEWVLIPRERTYWYRY